MKTPRMAVQKFATQIDERVLREVRDVGKETGQTISKLVEDALVEHLRRVRVRPDDFDGDSFCNRFAQ